MTRTNLEKKILKAVRFYLAPDEREAVTLESRISGDLCFDSLDKTELALSIEKEFSFKEKDVVWQDLLDGRDPTVRELCDFVEKKIVTSVNQTARRFVT